MEDSTVTCTSAGMLTRVPYHPDRSDCQACEDVHRFQPDSPTTVACRLRHPTIAGFVRTELCRKRNARVLGISGSFCFDKNRRRVLRSLQESRSKDNVRGLVGGLVRVYLFDLGLYWISPPNPRPPSIAGSTNTVLLNDATAAFQTSVVTCAIVCNCTRRQCHAIQQRFAMGLRLLEITNLKAAHTACTYYVLYIGR